MERDIEALFSSFNGTADESGELLRSVLAQISEGRAPEA